MSEESGVHVNEPYGPDCVSGSSALTFGDEPLTLGVNSSSTEQSKAPTVGERHLHFLCPSNQSTPNSQRPSISEITNANNFMFVFQIHVFQNRSVFSLALSGSLTSILDPQAYM